MPARRSKTESDRQLLRSLKAENLRLHKKVASLEVKLLSAQNRAKALEERCKRGDRIDAMTAEERKARISELQVLLATADARKRQFTGGGTRGGGA